MPEMKSYAVVATAQVPDHVRAAEIAETLRRAAEAESRALNHGRPVGAGTITNIRSEALADLAEIVARLTARLA